MRFRTFAAAAGAAALLLVGTVPASALENPIDIRAELDLPGLRDGPLVLEVLGVTPGDGPELTGANVIANPSAWVGSLRVDVDPVAETITIDSDHIADFRRVTVRITSSEMSGLRVLSNTFGRYEPQGLELSYEADGTGATLTWLTDTEEAYNLIGSAVFTWIPTFTDVRGAHPFYQQIEWLAAEGLSTGTTVGDGLYFYPTAAMSRQAMAAFLFRYAGDPAFAAPATASFSDVPTTHPFFREIEWLADQGLSTGYQDGTFAPGAAISRQAMAAFLHRLAGEPPSMSPNFSDVPADHGFAAAIGWLESTGISGGYPDGTFRPGNTITRQATAAFLYRMDAAERSVM